MRYVLQAVLSNAQHPEYGQATIPFPIPNQNYDSTIELLGPMEIGDTLRQDCQVDELDSFYTVLNTLIGTQVTLDELEKCHEQNPAGQPADMRRIIHIRRAKPHIEHIRSEERRVGKECHSRC